MKVLDTGSKKWSKKIKCRECKAKLEIEEEDLYVVNTAMAYAGETWDPRMSVDCAVCKSEVRVSDSNIPSGIIRRKHEEKRKKLNL